MWSAGGSTQCFRHRPRLACRRCTESIILFPYKQASLLELERTALYTQYKAVTNATLQAPVLQTSLRKMFKRLEFALGMRSRRRAYAMQQCAITHGIRARSVPLLCCAQPEPSSSGLRVNAREVATDLNGSCNALLTF